jgi:hypothetical protein
MRTGQIGAAVERGLDREHRHLERRYKEVYRSSGDAEGRFTLLKAELGVEAARARVARDPGILGSLRGGWLTANGRKERAQALQSGRGIVNEEQNLSRAREEALRYRRAEEEQWRERAMIEVPALSAKAQAAIDAFGEARPGWTPPELSRDRNPTPERIVDMAKCARLYEAVLADGPLLAELNRFEKAAASRLGHDDQFGSPGSRQLSDAERQAERYYGVLVAARALHAWYPVLRDHVAADPTLKLRVEQAEFLLRRADEQRPGHRSPSSGPSFGPGM